MNRNRRIVVAALAATALAVPAAAGAQPGRGNGKAHEKKQRVGENGKKPRKVTFVFKGTFTAPETIEVVAGNAHARRGGFVGEAVTFDFDGAKVVVADTNGDQTLDVTDVTDGDRVLVQARMARGTGFAAEAAPLVARKLVDKTQPPLEDAGSEIEP